MAEGSEAMEPLTAPANATILICYHPHRRRRTVDTYTVCDYCLTMRETTASWAAATVRYHTNTALYDDQKQLLSSKWTPSRGQEPSYKPETPQPTLFSSSTAPSRPA